jgi:apolipoprotein N-acyltransferase
VKPGARRACVLRLALAFLAGALTVFGYAPFHVALLPVATVATLFWLWQRAETPREAALEGFAFGMGWLGIGISWISVALETFGVPRAIAFPGMLGLVVYLSLYPALAGWAVARMTHTDTKSRLVAAAGAWALAEWLRGTLLTGYGWLAIGYTQLLPNTALPLSGFAPVGGVYLVSFALAACSATLVAMADGIAAGRARAVASGLAFIALAMGSGALLARGEWTHAEGAPLTVSLVQGNVAQNLKFDPAFRARNFEIYEQLVARAQGRLVVLPESAFAAFIHEVPHDVLERLAESGRERNGDVVLGLFTMEMPSAGDDRDADDPLMYNSAISLGTAPPQLYRKHHLVPFGEAIPMRTVFGWFLNRVLNIPLADQAAGAAHQPPFEVAGQRVAINICYEDVFGAELAGIARTATLFVNVTNDVWYGHSIGAWQHNQIAAMRALELGRPMLRATNTGITSAIAHDGRVIAEMPWFEQGILEVEIAGRQGVTPYVVWRDWLVVGLACLALAWAGLSTRRSRRPA